MSGRKPNKTINEIKQEFKEKGAVLLTKEYKSCNQQLQFKCSKCGKVHQISYRSFNSGRNPNLLCRDCMKSVSIATIKDEFSKKGAKVKSTKFVNVDTPLSVSCSSCGSIFTITWANYKSGHNKSLCCPRCRNTKNIVVNNDIKTELIAYENMRDSLYRKKLTEAKNGFRYIPLFPGEQKSDLIQSMLSIRNNTGKRIYARNCEIAELNTAKAFLNENHVQGYRKAAVTLGLYCENDLVFVMSFSKPRFNLNYEYELLRMATLRDYVVVGGASKVFKYFIANYKPHSIVSYCDVRFCDIDPEKTVYNKLGFSYLYKTDPNYRYWTKDFSKSYSRLACQKHRLPLFLSSFDKNKSEYQNMSDAGFIRIFDCGNYVFSWKSVD